MAILPTEVWPQVISSNKPPTKYRNTHVHQAKMAGYAYESVWQTSHIAWATPGCWECRDASPPCTRARRNVLLWFKIIIFKCPLLYSVYTVLFIVLCTDLTNTVVPSGAQMHQFSKFLKFVPTIFFIESIDYRFQCLKQTYLEKWCFSLKYRIKYRCSQWCANAPVLQFFEILLYLLHSIYKLSLPVVKTEVQSYLVITRTSL